MNAANNYMRLPEKIGNWNLADLLLWLDPELESGLIE